MQEAHKDYIIRQTLQADDGNGKSVSFHFKRLGRPRGGLHSRPD